MQQLCIVNKAKQSSFHVTVKSQNNIGLGQANYSFINFAINMEVTTI